MVLLQGGFNSWFTYKEGPIFISSTRRVQFLVLLQGKDGSILSSPTRRGSFLVLLQGKDGSILSSFEREGGFHSWFSYTERIVPFLVLL